MSASSKLQELQKLFDEGEDADLDRIQTLAREFLSTDQKDADMIRTVIVATIMKEEYKKAISLIDKATPDLKKSLAFEQLYCYYQLKQNKKAQSLCESIPDRSKSKGFWHIQAQLLRRLGDISAAASIYEKQFISRKARMKAENGGEIRANYLACLADTQPSKAIEYAEKLNEKEWGYASCLNVVAPLISQNKIKKAQEMLEKAEVLCREELKDEEEKELENELENVKLMQGYVSQVAGDAKEAEKIYRGLLKSKQPMVTAAVRLNLIQLKNGAGEESKEWSRTACNVPVGKLSDQQKRAARLNHCLVMLKGKRAKEQAQTFEQLKRKFPGSDYPVLCFASALLTAEGLRDAESRAEEVLNSFVDGDSSNKPTQAILALANLKITQRKPLEAAQALQSLPEQLRMQPGVVGTVVRLQRKMGKLDLADAVLNKAISYWKASNSPGAKAICDSLVAATADLKSKLGDYKAAAEAYEIMAKKTADVGQLCGVVVNASYCNMELAKKYAKKIPGVDLADIEGIEDLEALPAFGVAAMETDVKAAGAGSEKKKRKRKRKKRLPKNYDPNDTPDPERWLPKWERSYNKRGRGKRRNKNQMRGPQGGAVRADLAASLDKSAKPDNVEEDKKKKPPVAPKMSNRERRRAKKKKRR